VLLSLVVEVGDDPVEDVLLDPVTELSVDPVGDVSVVPVTEVSVEPERDVAVEPLGDVSIEVSLDPVTVPWLESLVPEVTPEPEVLAWVPDDAPVPLPCVELWPLEFPPVFWRFEPLTLVALADTPDDVAPLVVWVPLPPPVPSAPPSAIPSSDEPDAPPHATSVVTAMRTPIRETPKRRRSRCMVPAAYRDLRQTPRCRRPCASISIGTPRPPSIRRSSRP
jgi:hypothetical protein